MGQLRIPAVFMRGGTSKAIIFHRKDLPEDQARWDHIFLAAMGTPDPHGRQLDGMGGGISSLSKVCIIGPSSRPDADVDYTFAQIGVTKTMVDYSANCGNMSSAIGPFSMDEGLVARPDGQDGVVRIHNTNTRKIIVSRFKLDNGEAAVTGDMTLDGVSGTGSPIRLEFMDPGGAGTGHLLPTGNACDELDVPGLGKIPASMVDSSNPCVFVPAEALGCTGGEMPGDLEQNADLLDRLERIRCAASVAMGIAPNLEKAAAIPSIPKVAMVAPPAKAGTLSGRVLAPEEMDIQVRMISVGQPHRAVPLTGALCLAVGVRIPGSIPQAMAGGGVPADRSIRIAQPSGFTVVDAKLAAGSNEIRAEYAAVYRTARRLFEGYVRCRPPSAG